jgi:hypothetical protein
MVAPFLSTWFIYLSTRPHDTAGARPSEVFRGVARPESSGVEIRPFKSRPALTAPRDLSSGQTRFPSFTPEKCTLDTYRIIKNRYPALKISRATHISRQRNPLWCHTSLSFLMALEIRVLLHTVLNYFNLQSVASNFQVSFHPMLFLITHIMIFILLTYAISK